MGFKTKKGGLLRDNVTLVGTVVWVGPAREARRQYQVNTKKSRKWCRIKCGPSFYMKQLTSLLDPNSLEGEI